MESELQKKQLLLAADEMPLLRECAFFKSEDGFVHPNRVLDFDVLIYVVSGSVHRDLAWCKLDVCFMGSASWCGYGIDKGVETLWGVDPSDFEKKRDTAVYQFYMDYLPDSGSERTERSFPCIFKRWNFDQSRPVSVLWNRRKRS